MVAKFKSAEKAVNGSSHYAESQIEELEDQQELEKREKNNERKCEVYGDKFRISKQIIMEIPKEGKNNNREEAIMDITIEEKQTMKE